MDSVEAGTYFLVGGKNHRVLEVDYTGNKVRCYWVARPKVELWVEWQSDFEVIGWRKL